MYCFPNFQSVHCSMSTFNCFLTCIQVPQETGRVVWYSHFFKNSPQFAVIHTVKGFSIANETEVDSFLELPFIFFYPMNVGNFLETRMAIHVSILALKTPFHIIKRSTNNKCCRGCIARENLYH